MGKKGFNQAGGGRNNQRPIQLPNHQHQAKGRNSRFQPPPQSTVAVPRPAFERLTKVLKKRAQSPETLTYHQLLMKLLQVPSKYPGHKKRPHVQPGPGPETYRAPLVGKAWMLASFRDALAANALRIEGLFNKEVFSM